MDAHSRARELAQRLVASGQEVGVQIAAYLHGELVVDVSEGKADVTTGRPVDERTLFPCGAGSVSTVVHVLAERGLLDYGDPVAAYWPEFGAHGKHDVTLAHVLTHSAGVPQAPPGITLDDFADWDGMCARIADLRPLWRAGTATGHHLLTFGFILGEVVRRVTGRPVSAVLRDEVAAPLGVPDDLCFDVPADDLAQTARLEDGDRSDPLGHYPDGSLYHEVHPPWMQVGAALGNRREWRTTARPSSGWGTAHALARMCAALIGEVDGVRLIGPVRTGRLSMVLPREDRVLGGPARMGLGYIVGTVDMGSVSAFGWWPSGGGLAFADPGRGFSFAYLPNLLTSGVLGAAYQAADEVRLALGLETAVLQAVRRRKAERAVRRIRARVIKRREAEAKRRR